MIDIQLVEYIKRQLQVGETQEKIKSDLLANGWTDVDINEAMLSLVPQNVPVMGQTTPIKSPRKTTPIIISIIILLVLGGGIIFAFKVYKTDPIQKINTQTAAENNNVEVAPIDDIEKNNNLENRANLPATTSNPSVNTNSSFKSIDLWTIYDKMTLALKNKDVSAFNIVSYVQVTPAQASQFSQTASFLYDQSIKTIKNDYINKWQDEKQAIYSTNPQKIDDAEVYGYAQGSVMFINKDGSWKVLLDSPEKGWNVVKKGTNKTAAQIEQDLQTMMLDSDKDGLTDEQEICSGSQQYNSKCVKTVPNKRDTNGNGWWDGIEANMNK